MLSGQMIVYAGSEGSILGIYEDAEMLGKGSMIDTTYARPRRCGANAGSGGSILGNPIYDGPEMLEKLRASFARLGCRLIVPVVAAERGYASSS